jgi:hypothetical protein
MVAEVRTAYDRLLDAILGTRAGGWAIRIHCLAALFS